MDKVGRWEKIKFFGARLLLSNRKKTQEILPSRFLPGPVPEMPASCQQGAGVSRTNPGLLRHQTQELSYLSFVLFKFQPLPAAHPGR